MKISSKLENLLRINASAFHPVIEFNPQKDCFLQLDFTRENKEFNSSIFNDVEELSDYINSKLNGANCRFGIGGYNELRELYARSDLFNQNKKNSELTTEEPRRLHLGTDIWGDAGTPVFAPFAGKIHSFAFNANYGDYGATIILQHNLEEVLFHTLYGHVSLIDIQHLSEGDHINQGEVFAHLGKPDENGYWPPHLHLQIIENTENMKGNFPGVCKYTEREFYLSNCPNPEYLLQLNQYTKLK